MLRLSGGRPCCRVGVASPCGFLPPIHPDRFSQMFDRHVRRAGLPRIMLHDLRHTHASILLKLGVSMKTVSDRLAPIVITLDTYGHLLPGQDASAANLFSSVVLGASVSKM